MKFTKVLPISAMLLVGLVWGCNKDAGMSSDLSSTDIKKGSVAQVAAVNLRYAADFVILAESGISTTGVTAITGDIGVSPYALTYMTGFNQILDRTGLFAKSVLVTGNIYAADMGSSTATKLTTAVLNMGTAYTDAAGRAAGVTELKSGNLGGLTLAPGVYKWSNAVIIPKDLHLSGNSDAIWIFQVAGTLNISSATRVILAGGAQAKNIFWVVADVVTLGTASHFEGNILGQTMIRVQTGASINGRLLAQSAVTLDAATVLKAR